MPKLQVTPKPIYLGRGELGRRRNGNGGAGERERGFFLFFSVCSGN
jgi:hypothetical protein